MDSEDIIDYQSIFGINDKNKVDILTIDSIMYKYFCEYKKANKFKYDVLTDNKEKATILAQCISELSKVYKNVNIGSEEPCFLFG